jgi:hypothetical protein
LCAFESTVLADYAKKHPDHVVALIMKDEGRQAEIKRKQEEIKRKQKEKTIRETWSSIWPRQKA